MDVPHRGPLSASAVLVVTAVAAERDAVLPALADAVVVVGGVGPAAAAAATAAALARGEFAAVWSLGVAGGLAGRCAPGQLAVATAAVAADLGADSPDGFLPLDGLGLGPVRIPADPAPAAPLTRAGLPVVTGEVLTVCRVTGTDARAAELAAAHPAAVAEAMEGFGVATAAAAAGVPFAEVRAVSNPVGRRDRSGWDLPGALDLLRRAAEALAAGRTDPPHEGDRP